jgi:hypothetical protein
LPANGGKPTDKPPQRKTNPLPILASARGWFFFVPFVAFCSIDFLLCGDKANVIQPHHVGFVGLRVCAEDLDLEPMVSIFYFKFF